MVQATVLLCDYAEEVGGKLYVMGGGWSLLRAAGPSQMALAVKLGVPWDQANRRLSFRAVLIDEDGQPARQPDGTAIEFSAGVEVGRPAGLPPGTVLDAPLAIRFGGIALQPGGYRWDLTVGDEVVASVPFRVVDQ